jgi:hypothetical protein
MPAAVIVQSLVSGGARARLSLQRFFGEGRPRQLQAVYTPEQSIKISQRSGKYVHVPSLLLIR